MSHELLAKRTERGVRRPCHELPPNQRPPRKVSGGGVKRNELPVGFFTRPNPYTVAIGNRSDGHQGAAEEDEPRLRRSHSQDVSEAGRSTQSLHVGLPPFSRCEARGRRDSGVRGSFPVAIQEVKLHWSKGWSFQDLYRNPDFYGYTRGLYAFLSPSPIALLYIGMTYNQVSAGRLRTTSGQPTDVSRSSRGRIPWVAGSTRMPRRIPG